MWKAQKLVLGSDVGPRARGGQIGRVWRNVATPKRRRAVIERQAILARIDNRDALIRVVRS